MWNPWASGWSNVDNPPVLVVPTRHGKTKTIIGRFGHAPRRLRSTRADGLRLAAAFIVLSRVEETLGDVAPPVVSLDTPSRAELHATSPEVKMALLLESGSGSSRCQELSNGCHLRHVVRRSNRAGKNLDPVEDHPCGQRKPLARRPGVALPKPNPCSCHRQHNAAVKGRIVTTFIQSLTAPWLRCPCALPHCCPVAVSATESNGRSTP
ncbi:hypothetical protein IWZ00DRAFT_218054 [Phyllosticta capitalensis]|uniref:Uncharacterized protein n=1 Tax=Phyllosticta capitalensis TaxID=121624 RepID=A0ABR1YS97_9PEZI